MDLLLTHGYTLDEDPSEVYPYAPLGLLYLSSFLKREGASVEVYDTTFGSLAGFDQAVAARRPPVVGISGNLRTRRNVLEMIQIAKRHGAAVVLGGPEPFSYADEYLARGADVVVAGEGEATLAELLPVLGESRTGDHAGLAGVAGIACRQGDGTVLRTPARPALPTLDDLPFPDREAIQIDRYFQTWRRHRGHSALSLITARGCAYHCTWCSHSVFGFTHRRRSPQNVADEVEMLVERYQPELLWYADDVFTVHPRWIREYAAELGRRGLRVPFEAISREDRLDDEIIGTLAEMGCFRLWVGAESGSQRVLDLMKRRTDAGRMREVFGSLQRHGIEAGTFIMVGYDGETLEDLEATVDYLKDAAPDTFLTTVAYPIKGTEYYDHVADRLEPDLAWETGSDRDLRVVGSGSPRYYRYAIRWMVNEVALARWRGGGVMGLVRWLRTVLSARLGRLGMRWAKGPV